MFDQQLNYQRLFFEAMEYANWGLRNQRRRVSQTPCVSHSFHAVILLMSYGITLDEYNNLMVLQGEILHDTWEENPAEIDIYTIERKFGNIVAGIVRGVTLDPVNPDKRLARKKILEQGDWMVQIVKVGDVMSNTISVTNLIMENGFENTQKHFYQPIRERVDMEREFLSGIKSNTNQSLVNITKGALRVIDELEMLIK